MTLGRPRSGALAALVALAASATSCTETECATPDYTRAECRVLAENGFGRLRTSTGVEVRFQAPSATDPLAGSGLPLWLPAGAAIRDELQRLAKEIAHADGCVDVHTPVLGKRALFERSGHWAKFSADMFPPMDLGHDEVVLRRTAPTTP